MKILVTGGSVFVSKFTAEYFTGAGHDVYVLNRNTKPQPHGATVIECDREHISGQLRGKTFDVVIDVTAYTAEHVNHLLDNLDGFDNYILISSSAVYPDTLPLPFKETDPCGANKFWGEYGTNKLAAEAALLSRVPTAYIIRPPYLYGEYNNVYREAFVFDCAERGAPFYLPKDGAMPLQFFHVEDLCHFIDILIAHKPDNRIFNVGNAPVSIKQWVELCYAAVGKRPTFVNVGAEIEQRSYFPFYDYPYVLDVTAQNAIMPTLLPLDVGLRRAYLQYTQNRNQVKPKGYFDYISRYLA